MERYIGHIISSSEDKVDYFMKHQVMDETRLDYGSLPHDLVDVKPTVYTLSTAVALYFNEHSKYYKNKELHNRILLALIFIKRLQRPDGTFDFPSCNFMSAPDTSFCLKRLIAGHNLLVKYGDETTENLRGAYVAIIRPACMGAMQGGFHTPNHRWGILAALMQGAEIFKDEPLAEELRKRAAQYLAEGIDGNEDGEYAERSTGNYNAVVNTALISTYEVTQDEAFLGYVRRNLEMMLTYLEPDDTIFTQNSTRQDKGKKQYAEKYFYQFLYLAEKYGIPEFDKAAHKIIKDNMKRGDVAPDCMHIIMLQEQLQAYKFEDYGFLETYRKHYKDSGVVRVKTPKYTYSLLQNSSRFLFLQTGGTPIYMRIGVSYCSIRSFAAQSIEVLEGKTVLKCRAEGWYYLPFENYEGTSDWWKMDHSKREILNNTYLELQVEVTEKEDGLDVTVKSEGCDRMPIRIEVCVPDQSTIENEHFHMTAHAGQGMILRDGYVNVHHEEEVITVGPGVGTHGFKGHYSGEEKNEHTYTLHFNEYTNLNRTIELRVK